MESKEGSYFSLSIFSGDVVEGCNLIFQFPLRLTSLLPLSKKNNRESISFTIFETKRKGKRTYVREDKIHYLSSYFLS